MSTRIRFGQFFSTLTLACSLLPMPLTVNGAPEPGQGIQEPRSPIKAAIIVRNRAGKELNDQQRILEDLIAGEITRLGVRIISREDSLESVGTYEEGRSEAAVEVDQLFMDNTSAVRLAQNLGADYLLTASILSAGSDESSFSGYGIKSIHIETSLRLHYRIVGRVDGGSVVSENISVSRKERKQLHQGLENQGLVTSLLQEAATEMAQSLEKQLANLPDAADALPDFVNVTVQATMQDLSIPDVVRNEGGEYTVTANTYQLAVFGANVEVNGLTIGTTSGETPLQVPPGINKLRISRSGYEDEIRTVNFFDGQQLLIPMQMSEAGFARMREMTEMFQEMKANAKLTDAEVSKAEAFAQFLRQSGIRIDHRSNTTEPIQVNQNVNSLFRGIETPTK